MIKNPDDLAIYLSNNNIPISKWAGDFILLNEELITKFFKRYSATLLASTDNIETLRPCLNEIWGLGLKSIGAVVSKVTGIPEIELDCEIEPDILISEKGIEQVNLPPWLTYIVRKKYTCNWDADHSNLEEFAKSDIMFSCKTIVSKYMFDASKVANDFIKTHQLYYSKSKHKKFLKYISEMNLDLPDKSLDEVYDKIIEKQPIFNMIV